MTQPGGYFYPRTLEDFRLNFKSDKYPLLAFIYALLAGGEGTLHFDYTEKYNAAYLLEPFGGNRQNSPAHVQRFLAKLDELELRTEGRTKYVAMEPADWDVFLECLSVELKSQPHSNQFW